MLRILTEEDGFQIDLRDLQRLRARHRLLLRETGHSWNKRQSTGAAGGSQQQDASQDDAERQGDVYGSSEDDENEPGPSGSFGNGPSPAPNLSGPGSGTAGSTPELESTASRLASRDERRRILEAEGSERLASRKRRRRTKGWAGFPADPPGPPRFPSETTLDQAKEILQLDAQRYREMRDNFRAVCEQEGIVKKTLAGPEKWEAAKERLIMDSMHLRAVMYGNEKTDLKRLAIDIIACDVTKRLRNADRAVSIPEAKSILGLNPEQGREVRFAFYRILSEDQFTGKILSGPEHWDALKQRWVDASELLQKILSGAADAGPSREEKLKAFEVLARDVRKRYQEDMRAEKKPDHGRKPGAAAAAGAAKKRSAAENAPSTPEAMEHDAANYEVARLSQLSMTPGTPDVPRPDDSTEPSSSQRQRPLQRPSRVLRAHVVAHSPTAQMPEPRLLPSQVMNAGPELSMDPDLSSSMLLGTDAQTAFLNQQFVQAYVPAQQAPPVFHQPAPVMAPFAVYLRMDPSSSFPAVTPMWITMMHSRTMAELRSAAAEKYPSSICLGVQGVIKDDKGGELPLGVNEDAELDAYLDHMEGRGAPTFNVQIRVVHGLAPGLGVQGQAGGWS